MEKEDGKKLKIMVISNQYELMGYDISKEVEPHWKGTYIVRMP